MTQPDTPQPQEPKPSSRAERRGRTRTEFDMLQSLLVEPEVDKLRHQVSEQQQQIATLQAKVQKLETEVRDYRSLTHQLIDQKLSELQQKLFASLPDMIDEAIEEQIDPGQTFSIRVSGVEDD